MSDLAIEPTLKLNEARARVAQLEATCRSAGLCMSCLYGAPDPIGCTDCLGTGWDGGDPHNQIKVLEARVAELVDLLRQAAESIERSLAEKKALRARVAEFGGQSDNG